MKFSWELFYCNLLYLLCVRQVLTNGSLYVESDLAQEGVYQCQASVSGVGILISRMAHVKIACKFVMCSLYVVLFLLTKTKTKIVFNDN